MNFFLLSEQVLLLKGLRMLHKCLHIWLVRTQAQTIFVQNWQLRGFVEWNSVERLQILCEDKNRLRVIPAGIQNQVGWIIGWENFDFRLNFTNWEFVAQQLVERIWNHKLVLNSLNGCHHNFPVPLVIIETCKNTFETASNFSLIN